MLVLSEYPDNNTHLINLCNSHQQATPMFIMLAIVDFACMCMQCAHIWQYLMIPTRCVDHSVK